MYGPRSWDCASVLVCLILFEASSWGRNGVRSHRKQPVHPYRIAWDGLSSRVAGWKDVI